LAEARKQLKPNSNNLAEVSKWGRFARQFNKDQQDLYKSELIETMPVSPLKLQLGSACAYLWNYFEAIIKENDAECSKWADEIDEQLNQAEQEILELKPSLPARATKEEILDQKPTVPAQATNEVKGNAVGGLGRRVWKSRDGSFSVEAELLEATTKSVKLRRKDGTVIDVLIEKLSIADQILIGRSTKQHTP
jgi:hypothetical protein